MPLMIRSPAPTAPPRLRAQAQLSKRALFPGLRAAVLLGLTLGTLACSGGNGGDGAGPSGGGPAADPVPLGDPRSGEGTYYDADGTGACAFDAGRSPLRVAALNAPDWSGSASCGACAAVTGPEGSVTVRIVDLCPECSSGDLDLSLDAFTELAPQEHGRVPIEWTLVPCDVSGPLRYLYKDGSNPWWTAIQIRNHRLPIARVEWSADGSTFEALERTDYNYFLTESGFGEGRVHVRVTAIDGQVLEDELPPVQELLEVAGAAQFR